MSDRPVVILGAGASKEYGGPLMVDFVDRAEQVLPRGESYKSKELLGTALELRSELRRYQSSGNVNIDNIEDVLSIVDTASLSGVRLLRGIAPRLLAEVYREFIARTVENSTNNNLSPIQLSYRDPHLQVSVLERLHNILEHRHECRPEYITFNYDLTLEHALISKALTPRYHQGYEKAYNPYSSNGSCHVAKLHGSVNWFGNGQKGHLIHPYTYLRRTAPENTIGPSRLPNSPVFTVEGEELTKTRKAITEWSRIIVAPSTNKVVSGSTLGQVWKLAYSLLSQATHIYIIGYSWPSTDAATRHLFTLGLANASWIKTIQAVRPCEDNFTGVDQHYRSLLGPSTSSKFKLIDSTLQEYVDKPSH